MKEIFQAVIHAVRACQNCTYLQLAILPALICPPSGLKYLTSSEHIFIHVYMLYEVLIILYNYALIIIVLITD